MTFYYNIHNHSMKPVVTCLGPRLMRHKPPAKLHNLVNPDDKVIIKGPRIKNTIKK